MGKVVRVVGFIVLAVVVFWVVIERSAEQTTAVNGQIQFEPGAAAAQGQIEITRVVYVTATPQPAVMETETAVGTEPEPLIVVNRVPEGYQGADIQPTFQLTFNKPVEQRSRQYLVSVEPETAISIHWVDSNVLLLQPREPLVANNVYKFSLSPEITAVDGSVLAADYNWQYLAKPLIEKQRYEVLADGRGSFQFDFYYPIDPATVEWQIAPETEGELVWGEDFTHLAFEGESSFLAGRSYTMTLGQRVRQPNSLAVPIEDAIVMDIPELALGTEPRAGGVDVSPFATIEIRFRQAVNHETAEAGFTIEPEPLVGPVFEWQGNTMKADLTLMPKELYSVQIRAANLVDDQGRPLSWEPVGWSFRTTNEDNFAKFGNGPRIQTFQVGNGDGRPAIQYSFPDRNMPAPVTFSLYEMSVSDWLAAPMLSDHDLGEQRPILSWEEAAPPVNNERYFLAHETIMPEALGPGFYRLQMSAFGLVQDEMAIVMTDLGLAMRQDGAHVRAWVVNLATLAPVPADILLYQNGEVLATGATGGSGLATLDVGEIDLEGESSTLVLARSGDQFTVAALSYDWITYSSYGYDAPEYLLHLTMDRPLYEPGETAYLRAVVRGNDGLAPSLLPAGQTLTVTVYGATPEGGYVELETPVMMTTDEYGVAYGEFVVPEAFGTGQYHANVSYKDAEFVHDFEVAASQMDEAPIVTVSTAKIVGQGDMIDVMVEVKDRDGRPLADKTVKISYLHPAWDWNGCYWSGGMNEWVGEDGYDHSAQTDRDGVYAFSIPAEMGYSTHVAKDDSSMQHSIMAVVAEVYHVHASGKGFSIVETANAAEALAWIGSSNVQAAGRPFVIQGVVRDLLGTAVGGREVGLTLHEVGEYGLNNYSGPGALISEQRSVSNGEGVVSFNVVVEQPGYYDLRLVSEDEFGNEMYVFRPLYVTGDGEAKGVPDLGLGLAGSEHYTGQAGQLVILAARPGPALLTLSNREGTRSEIINLTGAVNVIDLPLSAADAPALTVQVDLWQSETAAFNGEDFESYFSRRDADLLTRSLTVDVINLDRQLEVSVLTAEPDGNGQTAVTVRVLNGRGEPVSAEVALSIASETLYSHFPDHNRPQYNSLYRAVDIEQSVYHSFAPRRDLSYEYWGGCGCGGGWWGNAYLPAPVNEMPSFWFSGLRTDFNGQATVMVSLPVHAAGWHFAAWAITADGQVGEGS